MQDEWTLLSNLPSVDAVDSQRRPWVKDTRGRHHNVHALLDWPPEALLSDNDDEQQPTASNNRKQTPTKTTATATGAGEPASY